jgi:ABC-type multidrug transport system fused ATPase/permease subunit
MKQLNEKNRFLMMKQCVLFCYHLAWKEKPSYFLYVLLNVFVNIVSPFVMIIGTKYLINEIAYLTNRRMDHIVGWVAFIVIGTFVCSVLKKIATEKENAINSIFYRVLATNLDHQTMKLNYASTENPKVMDQIQKATMALEETGIVDGITTSLIAMISQCFVLMGVTYLVIQCSGWLLIPVFISFIVSSIVNSKVTKIQEQAFEQMGSLWRKNDYYNNEVFDSRYAKDIRIYNGKDMLEYLQTNAGNPLASKQREINDDIWHFDRIRLFVSEGCNIGIYLIIGLKALAQRITLGDFSSLIQATVQFSFAMQQIVNGYLNLQYTSSRLQYYLDFMKRVEEQDQILSDENLIQKVPDISQKLTIEFCDVSFRYPNTENYCLRHVNIVIHKGEHLSIVGENGAGKTTFIKLICRMYQVDEGKILLNGININQFPYEDYVKLLAVVFQDYKLLAFSIRENLAFSDEISDETLLNLCKLGGIREWVESTEKKLDTNLYKNFDHTGIEPSGGQSQKLAIVRALYKNAPIVILDEPTAALDPISEYEIYKNFDQLVGRKTAIYISHRLSSCKFCDRIIVFHNGGIVEDGNHDKLIAIPNGYYAAMYLAQAKHYVNKTAITG